MSFPSVFSFKKALHVSWAFLGISVICSAHSDSHSKSNFHEVVVKHIYWEAFVDVPHRRIDAIEELTLEHLQPTPHLLLDTRGLSISKVSIASANRVHEPASWDLGTPDEILGQTLKVLIKAETKYVKIEYSVGADAEGLLYMDSNQSLTGKPFLFSQSESILARTWLALQDSPQVRFTFDAKVKLPAGDNSLVLMSAPNNPKAINPAGEYTFHQELPIPSYLMSLAVGPLRYTPLGARTGFYAELPLIKKAKGDLHQLETMLRAAENCFGPYPWKRYDVLILPERYPFGGMENPCITYASGTIITGDRSLTNVVLHEIAHSWFGNLVTHARWYDLALTEGIAEWAELTLNRLLNGDQHGNMLWINEIATLKEELAGYTPEQTLLCRTLPNPDHLFDYVPYSKGALLMESIKNQIGLSRTLDLLRRYTQEFAWKSITVQDFLKFLQKHLSSQELQLLNANAWFFEPGLPSNIPSFTSASFDAVRNVFQTWQQGGKLNANKWSTQEWVYCLDLMYNQGVEPTQLDQLEQDYKLTLKNGEIQRRFYQVSIKYDWEEVFPQMEKFLFRVGRNKLIVPIFKELCASNRATYAKNLMTRMQYHPITQGAINAAANCVHQ